MLDSIQFRNRVHGTQASLGHYFKISKGNSRLAILHHFLVMLQNFKVILDAFLGNFT